jgi:hypothetical protein
MDAMPHRSVAAPEGRRVWSTVVLCLLVTVSAPFFVAGLWRLGVPEPFVVAACGGVAGGLAALPHRGRPMAGAWLTGCVLWAGLLAYVVWQFSLGMQGFD